MKKFILSVAVAFGVGFATLTPSAQAQAVTETENYKLTTYTQEDLSRVWVFVDKAVGTRFLLTVKDEKGNVLYAKGVNKKEKLYAFKIDLSQTDNGMYYIETTDGKTPIRKTIRKEEIAYTVPTVTHRVVAMN